MSETATETALSTEREVSVRRNDLDEVLDALEAWCAGLPPGEKIPTHRELMARFGASERAVRWALDELRRRGVILRRQGASTVVAPRDATSLASARIAQRAEIPAEMSDSAQNATDTIVAIGPHDGAFFERCMHLVLRQAENAGLNLVCGLCAPDAEIPSFAVGRPVGVLLFGYRLAALGRRLQAAGQRVVLVGSPPLDAVPEVPCVYADQEQGGYLATRHLLELGHRRIAFGYDRQSLRWRGHERALREFQQRRERDQTRRDAVTLRELERSEVLENWRREPQLAAKYLQSAQAPTAIATWNDHDAAILLSTLRRAEIQVPQQVSVLGFDYLPEGQMVHPALTTIDSAIEAQLQAALNLLTRSVAPPTSHSVVVLPTLVVGESTQSAPEKFSEKSTA